MQHMKTHSILSLVRLRTQDSMLGSLFVNQNSAVHYSWQGLRLWSHGLDFKTRRRMTIKCKSQISRLQDLGSVCQWSCTAQRSRLLAHGVRLECSEFRIHRQEDCLKALVQGLWSLGHRYQDSWLYGLGFKRSDFLVQGKIKDLGPMKDSNTSSGLDEGSEVRVGE